MAKKTGNSGSKPPTGGNRSGSSRSTNKGTPRTFSDKATSTIQETQPPPTKPPGK